MLSPFCGVKWDRFWGGERGEFSTSWGLVDQLSVKSSGQAQEYVFHTSKKLASMKEV